MDKDTMMPLHLEPLHPTDLCEKRLWIGNLDTRVNEYVFINLLEYIRMPHCDLTETTDMGCNTWGSTFSPS
ncbi:unnamed protein product [Leptidea sinapis]|uniref:Uncharacterized protein n=1 Tax=Leptidea sinapis TaxID=189913 RepID=A0A5E4PU88_9NEOP|nr:unnamed protein product [Leptidea sinapis]